MAFGFEKGPPRCRSCWLALGKESGGEAIKGWMCPGSEIVQLGSKILFGSRN